MSLYDQLQTSSQVVLASDFGAIGNGINDDTQALQRAMDALTDGQTLKLAGRYKVSKNLAYRTDLYGAASMLGTYPTQGTQPCLALVAKRGVIVDLRGAELIVDQHGQGILDLFQCQSCLILGGTYTAPGLFPPIDSNTGYAEKGVVGAGFNTTVHSPPIDGARNNFVDTSASSQGGYGGGFPQDDGSSASTWGSWQGGWIGNYGDAITVIGGQGNRIVDAQVSGFNGYGLRVGLLNDPNGTALARIDPAAEPFTPQDTLIEGLDVRNCYTGGVQIDRGRRTKIRDCRFEDLGHPDSSLEHAWNSKIICDPGYGVPTSRYFPQEGLFVQDSYMLRCHRKALDVHNAYDAHFSGITARDSRFYAAGIAFDETLIDEAFAKDQSFSFRMTIENCDLQASGYGIFLANGALGRATREAANLWWARYDVTIKDNIIRAPWGIYNNFGHGRNKICGNRLVFSSNHRIEIGNSVYPTILDAAGIYIGDYASRGPVHGDVITGNLIENGPDGNFRFGFLINAQIAPYYAGNSVNVTPYTTGNSSEPYGSALPHRDGIATTAVYKLGTVTAGSWIGNQEWNDASGTASALASPF